VIVTALLLKPANQWTQWTSVSTRRMILALPWALRLLPLGIWYLRGFDNTPRAHVPTRYYPIRKVVYYQAIHRPASWDHCLNVERN
jgi:hypothetical protein